MSLITPEQFLEIADRMAQQYQILDNAIKSLSPPAVKASATLTPTTGTNNALLWTADTPGWAGNNISVTYVNPATPNAVLLVTTTGTDIVVYLATNASSVVTTTAAQIISLITADVNASPLVEVTNATGSTGAGVVTAIAKTYLTGGTHGYISTMVTSTDNIKEEEDLLLAADNYDYSLTTAEAITGMTEFAGMISALRAHMSNFGVVNLIDGFLTTNNIRVQRNFDTIYDITMESHLSGANVFTPDIITIAQINMTDGGVAQLTLNPTGAKATVTIQPAGTNNATTYTAMTAGTAGNAINIVYVSSGTPNTALCVEVEGKDIKVDLATDGSSNIISTAAQVRAAVNANTAAAALVVGTAPGAETGIVAAVSQTFLTNRFTSILYSAVTSGSQGNSISIAYLDPGAPSQALSVSVVGKAISVHLATDGTGNITSTAAQVLAAVQASAPAASLVSAVANDSGASVVSAVPATFLYGGALATIVQNNPLGTGTGPASEDPKAQNYAAQNMNLVVTPVQKQASVTIYPTNANAFLDVKTTGTNNTVRFTSTTAGLGGNSTTIQFVYRQCPSVAEAVSISSGAITFVLGTDAGSAISSTANSIVTTCNGSPPASALVTAALPPGGVGTGKIGSAYPTTNLTNSRTQVKYTAVTPGAAGENIQIQYVNPGTANAIESVSVAGNVITVNLATNAASQVTSTPASIIATVNASAPATALVSASLPQGGFSDGPVAAVAATNLVDGAGPNTKRNTTLALNLFRSDLVTVTRDVSIPAGTVSGTAIPIGPVAASLLLVITQGGNNALLYTAVTPGAAGNNITIAYVNSGIPAASLSVTVSGNAITVNLATDQTGRAITTANEALVAVNGYGPAAALVTVTNSGPGYGYLAATSPMNLTGGGPAERYYQLTGVSVLSGGEGGDSYVLNNIPERVISL